METDAVVRTSVPSPTLRVIGAGLGRTGTHSLIEALEHLGYTPCESGINCIRHPKRYASWLDAAQRRRIGEPIDWRPLFNGYQATVEWPGVFFWRDLVEAHPEAKVILTSRDSDRWYDSFQSTVYANLQTWTGTRPARALYGLLAWLDQGTRDRLRVNRETIWDGTFGDRFEDREHAIRVYEEHNREVKATIPSERLLVFDVNQGWEPLCRFLGVPVPLNLPFPHVNTPSDFRRRPWRHYFRIGRVVLRAFGVAGAIAVTAGFTARRWFRLARSSK